MIKSYSDYGLTTKDVFHATQMAEHKDIIAKIVVDALDIPTRAAVEKEIKKREAKENNEQLRNTRPDLPTGKYQVYCVIALSIRSVGSLWGILFLSFQYNFCCISGLILFQLCFTVNSLKTDSLRYVYSLFIPMS